MGTLTLFLQESFRRNCPTGWNCYSEQTLLNESQRLLLGYSPRADILLEKKDNSLRLWIEFEVSRADPVANHAKFATTHIFFPWPTTDVFLSMVSSHVTRGRNNLAANTIWLMRKIGLSAYQTSLLPQFSPDAIHRLNHLPITALNSESIPVEMEIERAMKIIIPVEEVNQRKIHYVANLNEVMHNVAQWNRDMELVANRALWGRRRITYFVYNPYTGEFAPSKYCAYVAFENITTISVVSGATMNIPLYVQIPWNESLFDGKLARTHLEKHFGMQLIDLRNNLSLQLKFENWYQKNSESLILSQAGTFVLSPPEWY